MAEQHTVHTEHRESTRLSGPSFFSRFGRLIIGGILLLAIAGGLIWWLANRNNDGREDPDISDIRNAFPDLTQNDSDQATNTPNFFGTPTTTPANPPAGGTTPPTPATPSPRGTPPARSNTAYRAPVRTQPVAAPSVYRNEPLGFEMTMPGAWVTDPAQNTDNRVMFFNRATGNMLGYMSVYPNSSGDSIDELEQMLKTSPDVASASRTTVAGHQAVAYTTRSGERSLAVLNGSRVYYLYNHLADASVVNAIRFL